MISEKQLSNVFDSFWNHHFPLLTPTFVRRINNAKQRLTAGKRKPIGPVPMSPDVERFDLVAEIAFESAREDYEDNFSGEPGLTAEQRATRKLANLTGIAGYPSPSQAEILEANKLFSTYKVFLNKISSPLQFRPIIKGAGILDAMEADFCSADTLYEVKAVNRNLQSNDLRQLICYLVAGLGSRQYTWTEFCIFNPRLSLIYHGKIDAVLEYLSGQAYQDCIATVLDDLMEREEPLEIRF